MNKIYGSILQILFLSGSMMACHSSTGSTASANADASPTPSSMGRSAATFTGKNGRASVNGDLVQANNGLLTVNGVSYGTVNQNSVITYIVQNQEKILSVDGVVRKPAP